MDRTMQYLVTGAAGFIGYHVSQRLLARGERVLGIDNLNDYYDVRLKQSRLQELLKFSNFGFTRLDIADRQETAQFFSDHEFDVVIHLAAQAGVRYSLENPHAYADSNLVGFLNILEGCRQSQPRHLVYASSSSVYGANHKVPFAVSDPVNQPVSLYAATKRANELMAETYCHLFGIPMTGLRFFTVYGPWGRPDMAIFKFTKAILAGEPIDVFNHGQMRRDFTYIDDIVDGILSIADKSVQRIADKDSAASHKLFNIGNNTPVELEYLITALEKSLGKQAVKRYLPMQPGDLVETYADIDDLVREFGFTPRTGIEEGIERFVAWYRSYHQLAVAHVRRAA
jgi:UDP-glucuronate 4-epimerase